MTDFVSKVFTVNLADGTWEVAVSGNVEFHVLASLPGVVPNGLITGGTTGQVLAKSSGVDFAVNWVTPDYQIPAGGTTGQTLTKSSGVDYAVGWATPPAALVASVFGRTGAVAAASGDYNTSQVTENVAALYYTEGRVSANTDVAANTSARHSHSNSAQLALVTDGDHDVRTDNPHGTTKTHVGLGSVTDAAQLTRAAGDWAAFTEATPAATDLILIEDADDGGAKKKVQVSSLAAYAVKALPEAIEICFDGGGAALTVDKKVDIVAKCAMTITGWTLLADQSGSVAIGVWKDTYANFPPVIADVLVTPAITTAVTAQASSLNLAVAAGDILRFNVNSATTIQRVTLALTGVRA